MRKVISLMILLALGGALAMGQSHQAVRDSMARRSHRVIPFGEGANPAKDSIDRVIEMFYVDQFKAFQDPSAPYFLFISKDTRLAMGVGGMVRMRGWFDFAGQVPANGFYPSLIPVPANPLLRKRFSGTPGGSGLYMRVIGRNIHNYNVSAYVQADFSDGDSYRFKLKKAYFTANDWTVGYATTTFSDVEAEAPFIDGGGANGKTSMAAMLVRWLHTPKSQRATYAVSLEIPQSQYAADGVSVGHLSDWVPDVAAFAQLNLGTGQHLRLAGLARLLAYRDLVQAHNQNVFGWGLQLSGLYKPGDANLTVMGTFNGGQGYASHVGDLMIGQYDLVAEADRPGRMYAPWAGSGSVGLKYDFSPQWFASSSVGQVRYWPKAGTYAPDEYKYGRYWNINLFYQPTPRLQSGVELVMGQRKNMDGEHAAAHRVDFLFMFAF